MTTGSVIVKMDREVHAGLKVIAGMQGITITELLNSIVAREISAWEALHGVQLNELRVKAPASTPRKKPAAAKKT